MKTRASYPWTEALHYLMAQRHWRQADVVLASGIDQTTISRLWRGGHTTTRLLAHLAKSLNIPLEDLLVSPAYRDKEQQHRQLVAEITERVLRETQRPTATARDRTDAAVEALHDFVRAEEQEEEETRQPKSRAGKRPKKNSAKETRKVS